MYYVHILYKAHRGGRGGRGWFRGGSVYKMDRVLNVQYIY